MHYFRFTVFYNLELSGTQAIIGLFVKQFVLCCVPCFVMITGYLYGNREIQLSKQYCLKLLKVIIPYILCSIPYFLFVYDGNKSFISFFKFIFDFTNNGYCWYIGMYIGLYFFIPFLNKLYRALNDKEKIKLFAVIYVFFFVAYTVNFFFKILPQYFVNSSYILLYYFIGAYIKEHKLSGNKYKSLCLSIFFWLLNVLFAIWFDFGKQIATTVPFYDYQGIFIPLQCAFLFDFFVQIDMKKICEKIKSIISKLADCVLPAYMISSTTDIYLYNIIFPATIHGFSMTENFSMIYFIPIMIINLVINISLGFIINILSNKILLLMKIQKRH